MGKMFFLLALLLSEAAVVRGFYSHGVDFVAAEGIKLRGVLTAPSRRVGSSYRGVLLIDGSGPNDRDERVPNTPYAPFRVLAEGLTARGFAVLRFDKRTCSPLNGHAKCHNNIGHINITRMTIDDFSNDAMAALLTGALRAAALTMPLLHRSSP